MIEDYEFDCTICGRHIKGEYGNNPFPIQNAGECCERCNINIVIPARIKHFKNLHL